MVGGVFKNENNKKTVTKKTQPGTINFPPPSPPLPLPLLFIAPLSLPELDPPSTTTLPSTRDLKSSTATGLMITDVTLWLCRCCCGGS